MDVIHLFHLLIIPKEPLLLKLTSQPLTRKTCQKARNSFFPLSGLSGEERPAVRSLTVLSQRPGLAGSHPPRRFGYTGPCFSYRSLSLPAFFTPLTGGSKQRVPFTPDASPLCLSCHKSSFSADLRHSDFISEAPLHPSSESYMFPRASPT